MKTVKNRLIIPMALFTMAALLTSCQSSNENTASAMSKVQKEWYVSTKVSVYDPGTNKIYNGTNPAIFGRLSASVDDADKHDIPTYGSVVGRKAAVVFIHNDWGERSGEYHSNYHDTIGEKESWEMTVFSSVPNAEVTLEWDGIYELTQKESGYAKNKVLDSATLEDLHLVDTETGEVINAVDDRKLNTYTFNIGADGSRTFIWALGKADSHSVSEGVNTYIQSKKKEVSAKAAKIVKDIATYGPEKFGLPPM